MIRGRIDNQIRTLRFLAGEMTQAELGERIGVTRQTVAAIEQGNIPPRSKPPSASQASSASRSRKCSNGWRIRGRPPRIEISGSEPSRHRERGEAIQNGLGRPDCFVASLLAMTIQPIRQG